MATLVSELGGSCSNSLATHNPEMVIYSVYRLEIHNREPFVGSGVHEPVVLSMQNFESWLQEKREVLESVATRD